MHVHVARSARRPGVAANDEEHPRERCSLRSDGAVREQLSPAGGTHSQSCVVLPAMRIVSGGSCRFAELRCAGSRDRILDPLSSQFGPSVDRGRRSWRRPKFVRLLRSDERFVGATACAVGPKDARCAAPRLLTCVTSRAASWWAFGSPLDRSRRYWRRPQCVCVVTSDVHFVAVAGRSDCPKHASRAAPKPSREVTVLRSGVLPMARVARCRSRRRRRRHLGGNEHRAIVASPDTAPTIAASACTVSITIGAPSSASMQRRRAGARRRTGATCSFAISAIGSAVVAIASASTVAPVSTSSLRRSKRCRSSASACTVSITIDAPSSAPMQRRRAGARRCTGATCSFVIRTIRTAVVAIASASTMASVSTSSRRS